MWALLFTLCCFSDGGELFEFYSVVFKRLTLQQASPSCLQCVFFLKFVLVESRSIHSGIAFEAILTGILGFLSFPLSSGIVPELR